MIPLSMTNLTKTTSLPQTIDGLRTLFDRANDGDDTVLPQVHELLELNPQNAIPMLYGDLAANNEATLIGRLASDNDARYAAIQKQVELKREELAGPDSSPLVNMLVDRIVVCWLQVQLGDQLCLETGWMTQPQMEHREKVRDRAHRRLLQAIKTLARVRKLAVPVVQVNVAERQVNVVG